jgi:ribosomal protein S18 acetylase RimI-like enzyme
MSLNIVPAGEERAPDIGAMLGRAFVNDPMIKWKLRADVGAQDIGRTFVGVALAHAQLGTLLEIEHGGGAAGWLAPTQMERFDDLIVGLARDTLEGLTDDGGARFDEFWAWIGRHSTHQSWYLDVVGVDPAHQGQGFGTALVNHGLAIAAAEGLAVELTTGVPENIAYYERLGFRVVEHDDAPDGGPHVWFMRAEP